MGRRQVCHQGLFHPLGGGHEDPIKSEQAEQGERRPGRQQAQTEVERPVGPPADYDQAHAPQPVRQGGQRGRKQHRDEGDRRPGQRHLGLRQTQFPGTQQQEHIRRVAQGEQGQHDQIALEGGRQSR